MKLVKITGIITTMFFLGIMVMPANSNAMLITSEDFEGGATGWSNNTTTVGPAAFTEFLGRFGGTGGAQSIFKNYTLPGTQTQVVIDFDFYEIDSWDGELFKVFVDDSVIFQSQFWVNSHFGNNDDPVDTATVTADPTNAGTTNIGFNGSFADEFFHYTITYNTTATDLKLGFGTTLNQVISDESWGIDNVVINDNSTALVPEPATVALLGIGLAGSGGIYHRRKLRKEAEQK